MSYSASLPRQNRERRSPSRRTIRCLEFLWRAGRGNLLEERCLALSSMAIISEQKECPSGKGSSRNPLFPADLPFLPPASRRRSRRVIFFCTQWRRYYAASGVFFSARHSCLTSSRSIIGITSSFFSRANRNFSADLVENDRGSRKDGCRGALQPTRAANWRRCLEISASENYFSPLKAIFFTLLDSFKEIEGWTFFIIRGI